MFLENAHLQPNQALGQVGRSGTPCLTWFLQASHITVNDSPDVFLPRTLRSPSLHVHFPVLTGKDWTEGQGGQLLEERAALSSISG